MRDCVRNIGVAVFGLLGPVVWAVGAPTPAVVLSNASNWRWYPVHRAPVARAGGKLVSLGLYAYGGVWKPIEGGKNLAPTIDSPAFEGTCPTLAAICLRGKFRVTDPAAAGDLKLSVAYRGGVVVYLNGQEIARASIPEDQRPRGIEAVAEDYPREVFVKDDGKVISWGFGDPARCHAQLQQRVRRLDGVALPAKLLRKGVNVLAVEAHRAPYHDAIQGTSRSGRGKGYVINWTTVGVTDVALTGGAARGCKSGTRTPAGASAPAITAIPASRSGPSGWRGRGTGPSPARSSSARPTLCGGSRPSRAR